MARILVVDDSLTDRKMMEGLIRQNSDHSVDTANDGSSALDSIRQTQPDLVVTDLRMPEMDGLELVLKAKDEFPNVPVILVTGEGSQGMAMRALRSGAASYVPKSHLNQILLPTINQLIETSASDLTYGRLIASLKDSRFEFELENDPALIPPLVDMLSQMTAGMIMCGIPERRCVGIALYEAILNAMYHGNLELPVEDLPEVRYQLQANSRVPLIEERRSEQPYCDRRVAVQAVITPQQANFFVRDEGMGFHPGNIPETGDPKTLVKDGGRGLILMKNFMDEVGFNAIGNEVKLIKRRKA